MKARFCLVWCVAILTSSVFGADISIKDHRAHPTRLIAKLASPLAGASAAVAEAQSLASAQGMEIVKEFVSTAAPPFFERL